MMKLLEVFQKGGVVTAKEVNTKLTNLVGTKYGAEKQALLNEIEKAKLPSSGEYKFYDDGSFDYFDESGEKQTVAFLKKHSEKSPFRKVTQGKKIRRSGLLSLVQPEEVEVKDNTTTSTTTDSTTKTKKPVTTKRNTANLNAQQTTLNSQLSKADDIQQQPLPPLSIPPLSTGGSGVRGPVGTTQQQTKKPTYPVDPENIAKLKEDISKQPEVKVPQFVLPEIKDKNDVQYLIDNYSHFDKMSDEELEKLNQHIEQAEKNQVEYLKQVSKPENAPYKYQTVQERNRNIEQLQIVQKLKDYKKNFKQIYNTRRNKQAAENITKTLKEQGIDPLKDVRKLSQQYKHGGRMRKYQSSGKFELPQDERLKQINQYTQNLSKEDKDLLGWNPDPAFRREFDTSGFGTYNLDDKGIVKRAQYIKPDTPIDDSGDQKTLPYDPKKGINWKNVGQDAFRYGRHFANLLLAKKVKAPILRNIPGVVRPAQGIPEQIKQGLQSEIYRGTKVAPTASSSLNTVRQAANQSQRLRALRQLAMDDAQALRQDEVRQAGEETRERQQAQQIINANEQARFNTRMADTQAKQQALSATLSGISGEVSDDINYQRQLEYMKGMGRQQQSKIDANMTYRRLIADMNKYEVGTPEYDAARQKAINFRQNYNTDIEGQFEDTLALYKKKGGKVTITKKEMTSDLKKLLSLSKTIENNFTKEKIAKDKNFNALIQQSLANLNKAFK